MTVTRAFGDVTVSVGDDLVATAEIRRPPHNFLDVALIAALADACDWLDGRALAGAGGTPKLTRRYPDALETAARIG